jgi:ABC-type lipoprotein release transport system permease subunit
MQLDGGHANSAFDQRWEHHPTRFGAWFIGSVAALSLGRALVSLQHGVTITDPLTWTIVLGVLAFTTLMASWRPARQAMRADPVVLLREQ